MTNERMKFEVDKRMNDNCWDRMISERVMDRKKILTEKKSFYGMAASLAMAAVSTIVFLFGPIVSNQTDILTASNFHSEDILNAGYGSSDENLSSEMDIIINEAYPMR